MTAALPTWLLFPGLLALSTTLSAGGDPPARPNVLVILADDIGVESLGTYGESPDAAPTPNLDALAASGVVFRNAWSNPSCSPTRAGIQTGRHGFRTGIGAIVTETYTAGPGLPLSEVTLPEMLDQGTSFAYAHGAFGKWHLGTLDNGGNLSPNTAGYAHFAGSMTNLKDGDDYFDWLKTVDGVDARTTTYATTDTVDSALAFVSTVQEPWFCSLNFHAGHTPFHEPPASLHSYDLTGAVLPNDSRLFYNAMVEAMDAEIGRLFATLGSAVMDDTLVIFVGDNGTPGLAAAPGYDFLRLKGTLYEGGVNVPFLVAGPGVAWQGESNALVHTVDVFATVAGAAGVDLATEFPTVQFDGVDLMPHLADVSVPTRAIVYTERFAPNGPGNPIPQPPCPDPLNPVCQEDYGFGGPGNLVLSMCGDELYGAVGVPLKLEGCPPNAVAFLARSEQPNPVPFLGGTVVPFPPTTFIVGLADANGEIVRTVQSFSKPFTAYFQAACVDPSTPQGIAFSNAVKADTLETNLRAARNARYKLIANENVCREEFYDLLADPAETVDLLAQGPLGADQLGNYLALRSFLDSM